MEYHVHYSSFLLLWTSVLLLSIASDDLSQERICFDSLGNSQDFNPCSGEDLEVPLSKALCCSALPSSAFVRARQGGRLPSHDEDPWAPSDALYSDLQILGGNKRSWSDSQLLEMYAYKGYATRVLAPLFKFTVAMEPSLYACQVNLELNQDLVESNRLNVFRADASSLEGALNEGLFTSFQPRVIALWSRGIPVLMLSHTIRFLLDVFPEVEDFLIMDYGVYPEVHEVLRSFILNLGMLRQRAFLGLGPGAVYAGGAHHPHDGSKHSEALWTTVLQPSSPRLPTEYPHRAERGSELELLGMQAETNLSDVLHALDQSGQPWSPRNAGHCAINLGANDGRSFEDPLWPLFDEQGFWGLAVEADPESAASCRQNLHERIEVFEAKVTPWNLESMLAEAKIPNECAIFKIDIDSYDCSIVLSAMEAGFRPAIVQLEVSFYFPPPLGFGMGFTPNFGKLFKEADAFIDLGAMYGCSLTTAIASLKAWGYDLAGIGGLMDVLFLRKDLVALAELGGLKSTKAIRWMTEREIYDAMTHHRWERWHSLQQIDLELPWKVLGALDWQESHHRSPDDMLTALQEVLPAECIERCWVWEALQTAHYQRRVENSSSEIKSVDELLANKTCPLPYVLSLDPLEFPRTLGRGFNDSRSGHASDDFKKLVPKSQTNMLSAAQQHGCADGSDDVTFVSGKVVGCHGVWSTPGIASGGQKLCATGWQICKSASTLSRLGVTYSMCSSCMRMERNTFYATMQSGTGSLQCNSSGSDDVWGCGCKGPTPGFTCGNVLPYVLRQDNWYAWLGFKNADQELNEMHVGFLGHGGVMCCKAVDPQDACVSMSCS